MKGRCKPLFPHYWSEKHFLLGVGSYVYKESEFYVDDSFQKKKLVDFVGRLDYIRGVSPLDEDGKKLLKRLIEVSLLVGSSSREGCWVVLGKLKISSILYC